MNTNNNALSVYKKAKARWDAGKETFVDEVVIALWQEVIAQSHTIRDQALITSSFEQTKQSTIAASPEYLAMMGKMGVRLTSEKIVYSGPDRRTKKRPLSEDALLAL